MSHPYPHTHIFDVVCLNEIVKNKKLEFPKFKVLFTNLINFKYDRSFDFHYHIIAKLFFGELFFLNLHQANKQSKS